MNYLLKKIKENVYSLRIITKNSIINKILKISVNEEEYLNEYNVYKELLIDNKNYNIENISSYLKFENINVNSNINITFIDDNVSVKIYVKDIIEHTYNGIINIYILHGNYNPNNKTLYYYLSYNDFNLLDIIINNALINRRNASNTQHLKHCDFKINNILIDNLLNVYLFDFDFSIILKSNETIKLLGDEKVNLYLNLEPNTEISGSFLDLFDIYLLALSIIYSYNTSNIKKLIKIQKHFKSCLLQHDETLCDDFFVFYTIYSNILLRIPKKLNNDIYLIFASYDMLYSILKNPFIEFIASTKYINAIEFIKKQLFIN
jgi:hypothetical protein